MSCSIRIGFFQRQWLYIYARRLSPFDKRRVRAEGFVLLDVDEVFNFVVIPARHTLGRHDRFYAHFL